MQKRFQGKLSTLTLATMGVIFTVVMAWDVQAQTTPTIAKVATNGKSPATTNHAAGQDWQTLTPSQQQALKPLAASWSQLSENHKKKWIALSTNFSTMSEPAKERLHARMAQWAALTPKQRTQARLNYAQTQRVPNEDKAERWEVYQALTAEQKQALAASAPKVPLAPRVKVPKTSVPQN